MPKILQWGLLLFFICALVASMAIASVAVALHIVSKAPRLQSFLVVAVADVGETMPRERTLRFSNGL